MVAALVDLVISPIILVIVVLVLFSCLIIVLPVINVGSFFVFFFVVELVVVLLDRFRVVLDWGVALALFDVRTLVAVLFVVLLFIPFLTFVVVLAALGVVLSCASSSSWKLPLTAMRMAAALICGMEVLDVVVSAALLLVVPSSMLLDQGSGLHICYQHSDCKAPSGHAFESTYVP